MGAVSSRSENPYLSALQEKSSEGFDGWEPFVNEHDDREYLRRDMVREYSWAIPNEEALSALESQGPILEVGAGRGYWAYLLRARGVDVAAFDIEPKSGPWTEITRGSHEVAAEHPERTLFLCWPTYADEWASQAVDMYPGDTVIYVGEGRGGCTADDTFHYRLSEKYGLAERIVENPQWRGIHDRMYIFTR